MALAHDSIDRITDRLVAILDADPDLSEGLPERVVVEKGVRRMDFAEAAVFVFRVSNDDYSYWMGGDGTDFVQTWGLLAIVRDLGDPAALESKLATLSCNVARVMVKHRGEPGYWDTAQLKKSVAVGVRNENEQSWETETVMVEVRWMDSDG